MTQRERFLAILVGGLLTVIVLQWGISSYRDAVRKRTTRIASLENEKARLDEQRIQGALADRQMGEYLSRSLPGDPEDKPGDFQQAQGDYQRWLLEMVQANQLADPKVDPTSPMPLGDLYERLTFSVNGSTDLPKLIDLLHAFYAKDYLHRIREFTLTRSRTGDGLDLKLTIDAIALNAAAPDAAPPKSKSWRVDPNVMAYRETILNRNFYEPPNAAPQYTGPAVIEAIRGRDSASPLTFKDPDGDKLRFEFADNPPEFARLDEESGTLRVNSSEKREFELLVRVTDDGYPRRSFEQSITVKVVDPPPPPSPPPSKLAFDDAKQTVLTGLVQGGDDWTAWMNVRTRGKTLKLRVGDQFEIGSLKGKVIEVTARFVVLEIDGRRFTLKPFGNLAEAAQRAEED